MGLLLLENDEIGNFYDAMKPYYDNIFATSRKQKEKRLEELRISGNIKEIHQISQSNRRFELKFKYVNFTTNRMYSDLITKYFSFTNLRFCALVVDRHKLSKHGLYPWDVYIHRAAMLLANNMTNINPCQVCVLADDLTRPKDRTKTFEQSIKDSVQDHLTKKRMGSSLFGVARLESHSSLMLQVVDILLGCVMYDFKKEVNLISIKLAQRQELVVDKVRKALSAETLAINKTYHQPSYFSVWKLQQ